MDERGQCAKAGSEKAVLIVLTSFDVSWLGYDRRHNDRGDERQSAFRLAQEKKRERLSPSIDSILSRESVPDSLRTSATTLLLNSGDLIRLTESNVTLSDLTRWTTLMTAEATARAALQEAISRRSAECARTCEYSAPTQDEWSRDRNPCRVDLGIALRRLRGRHPIAAAILTSVWYVRRTWFCMI